MTEETTDRKPKCIIFDIDGTVALRGKRDPHDLSRVGEDLPNVPVMSIARMLAFSIVFHIDVVSIVFTTGRKQVAEQQTEMWLDHHFGFEYTMVMRHNDDNRPDWQVKYDMLQMIAEKYDIVCVFDDRDQVVKMWRDNDIACFQVAPGDF